MFTAIADDVLATAAGRTLTAVVDDLPSTAPVPSLPRRLAGMVWTARSRDDLATCYGTDGARAITDATDVIVQTGGDRAVVQAGTSAPIGVRLRRVEPAVLGERDEARARIGEYRARQPAPRDLSRAALNAARDHGLHVESGDTAVIPGS